MRLLRVRAAHFSRPRGRRLQARPRLEALEDRLLLTSFAFSDFSSVAGLTLTGNAQQAGSVLRLVPAAPGQLGSAFFNTPVATDQSFETQFQFFLHDGSRADGFTFTVQNDPNGAKALGLGGGALGYARPAPGGIQPSVAVEFDIFNNGPLAFFFPNNDQDNNHVGLLENGSIFELVSAMPSFSLYGSPLNAWIDYDAPTHRLEVFVDPGPVKPATPLLSATVDLASIVGSSGLAGFTAATGGAFAAHDIQSWRFTQGPPAAPTDTWTGASSALWSDAGNWTAGIPKNGEDLIFPSVAANFANTNDLHGLSLHGIRFTGGGYTVGGQGVTVTGGVETAAGLSGTDTLALPLAGSGGVTVNDGTLRLAATAPNTYLGTTVVSAGMLVLDDTGGNAVPGQLVVGSENGPVTDPAKVILQAPEQIAATASLLFTGHSAFDSGGFTETIDNIGWIHWKDASGCIGANGVFVLNGGITAEPAADNTPVVLDANLVFPAGAHTFDIAPGGSGFAVDLRGTISGAGGLTLTGGGQLTFAGNGANTYAGPTIVEAGTLLLDQTGGSAIPGDLVIGNAADLSTPALVQLGADNQTAPTSSLTMTGNSQLDLNGNSDTINQEAMRTWNGGGSDVCIVGPGSTLNMNGDMTVIPDANGTVPIITADVALDARTFNVAAGPPGFELRITGVISGPPGFGLVKTGPGVLHLTADNTYAGDTTVEAGTLLIDGSQPQSAVFVAAGATLGGTGRVGPVTVSPGGTLTGRLQASAITWQPGSTFAEDLGGTAASQFDQLSAAGAVDLSGATLQLTSAGGFAVGQTFVIVRAGAPLTTTFQALPEGATVNAGGQVFTISYRNNQVTLTVQGAVPPVVQFGLAAESVRETAGRFEIPVALSAATGSAVSVPFTLGGSAAAGTDFRLITVSPLVIPAGRTSATISGTLLDDGPPNAVKTLTLTLGRPTGATLGGFTTNTLTITEPPPAVQFSAAAETVTETAGTFTLTVSLSKAAGQDVSVPFTLGGSAVAGTDFRGVSASPLVIPAGQTSATISGALLDDNRFDAANRTLTFTLGTPSGATRGGTTTNTLTIGEDADAPPTVQFATAAESISETAGTFGITVTLSAPAEVAIRVPFVLGGSAVAGVDYSGLTTSPLVISAGQTSGTITGTLLDDGASDGVKALTLKLGTSTDATLGDITTNTLTITELTPAARFSAAGEAVGPSTSGLRPSKSQSQ
jgi:autotransporter-associated beta strand protein